jgi:hypothetical protein
MAHTARILKRSAKEIYKLKKGGINEDWRKYLTINN